MSLMNRDMLYAGLFMAFTMILVPGLCILGVARGHGARDVNVKSCFFVFMLMYFLSNKFRTMSLSFIYDACVESYVSRL